MSPARQLEKLFTPIQVGHARLQHRVVMAPLTRLRTNASFGPSELTVKYYAQRAVAPGTLIITEGTLALPDQGTFPKGPILYTDEQVEDWKKVTDALHERGAVVYIQLAQLGRGAPEGNIVAPSPIGLPGYPVPREITTEEIKRLPEQFADAAEKAIVRAGFDGVEIHGANGYLIDEFIQDNSNHRTDEYGGSIENRARLPLEIIDAVVQKIGAERVGFRVSPWSTFQEMRMKDPIPTFSYIATQIRDRYPKFAYLHVIEARINGGGDREPLPDESNDFLRKIWTPRPFISSGGYDRQDGIEQAEKTGDLIAYGRYFISNPDLVRRLKENLSLVKGDRATYYTEGARGYTDYPYFDQANIDH